MDLFDKNGQPVAYIRDGYLHYWDGTPAAYVQNDAVYSLKRDLVSYLVNGWIIDRSGHAVVFSEDAAGGPMKPGRGMTPLKPFAPLQPIAPLMTLPALRPLQTMNWSRFSLKELLDH
ncbi:4-fold beta flower protein [Labrenzia sp. PHM005]|uniref:4-fold beta flower protein n=1 Tax=Labrenzia sp. PHM005 TaxID=2590016 RepID=UPI001140730D|nr:hypothetical protein [Labrenzia sp. PHM005]QDG75528.1 hypothetical protein FJ695_06420 [Labrenzia sp. PHM005]